MHVYVALQARPTGWNLEPGAGLLADQLAALPGGSVR
jgi:hypothetical protein